MSLFESPHIVITCDQKLKALITTWRGRPSDEEFARCIDKILEVLKEQSLHKILNDTRSLEPISLEAQQYVADTVTRFVQYYPFKQAHLLSKDAFVRFSVTNFDHLVREQGGNVNEIFDDETEARRWLKSQKVSGSFF